MRKHGPSGNGQTKVHDRSIDPKEHYRERKGITPGGRPYTAKWNATGEKKTTVFDEKGYKPYVKTTKSGKSTKMIDQTFSGKRTVSRGPTKPVKK